MARHILGAFLGSMTILSALASASPAVTYNNTLIEQRADPHIVKHTDGTYYFTATVPDYDAIVLRSAPDIQSLQSAEEVTIWTRKPSGTGSGQVWAPELHFIDGKWYIYVALGVAGEWTIRAFVLEGTGDNPLTAIWEEKGIVQTNWDTFSLDMSTFEVEGVRYLVWAQDDPTWGDSNTSIMLAPAENPWTISATAVAISRPDLAWERIGHNVNEGAYAIVRNGRVFITYSASATDSNYCMGLLSASVDADLMDPMSWTKAQESIFQSNEATGQWGPGHSSFTTSEDGLSDILVYHDRGYKDIDGDPLNDPNRRTRVQKLYWDENGFPVLGEPVPDGETPICLRTMADDASYIRHNGAGENAATSSSAPLIETQFRFRSVESDIVEIEASSKPGYYLVLSDDGLRLGSTEGDSTTFERVAGLADDKGVSFKLIDSENEYVLVGEGGELVVGMVEDESTGVQATFLLE